MKTETRLTRRVQSGVVKMQTIAIRKVAWCVVLTVALWCMESAKSATVVWKAPNVQVYTGLAYESLEFENPLTGTEQVLGHPVLDWRDADYNPSPFNGQYEDWSVYTAGGWIDGCETEIWMREAGQYIWTTTSVPSKVVTVHLFGDDNDGVAGIYVDDRLIARVSMAHPVGETALLIVRGLANVTHTIKVACESPDVAVLGAAALAEKPLKWDQPPVWATNSVFYGWNQISAEGYTTAADDWVCMSTNPITMVRWWGSFVDWVSNTPPPTRPTQFEICFWTDVPAGVDAPYSHPGILLKSIVCVPRTCEFAGWDYDPRTGQHEACFKFEAQLTPEQYFYQGPSNTIYWISIRARYDQGSPLQWVWGWKTRPRDPNSPAPDAAVISCEPPPPWTPILWPDTNTQWDLAFELVSDYELGFQKWYQPPDLSTNGMDVNITHVYQVMPLPGYVAGDDYLCTEPGWVTNITIWGSWSNDIVASPLPTFHVGIHEDIPATPTNYSRPGKTLWSRTFGPGTYQYSLYATNLEEWWFTPSDQARPAGDHACVQVNFSVPTPTAFYQAGSQTNPKVYWLIVQAQWTNQFIPGVFGWKTSTQHWNDAAVWANAVMPDSPTWFELLYPIRHPQAGQRVDLAFRLSGSRRIYEPKWSQPPVSSNAPVGYNGWNELSVYGGAQIVVDDWVCLSTNAVTDIRWWGSFIGWNTTNTPPQMPDAFMFTIWTDVPAGLLEPFSHPGTCVWAHLCTNYACYFVGWDLDPRNPTAPPEACFKFECDLFGNEFRQPGSSNIYWLSIAAVYHDQVVTNAWGWKTRPRDTNSLAPDGAVRIFEPTAPTVGSVYLQGEPVTWPWPTNLWDMAFQLSTRATDQQDFGDAPRQYPTKLVNTGARHYILPGFCLGTQIDAEPDGQPTTDAQGDDFTGLIDDEDGVQMYGFDFQNTRLVVGHSYTVTVELTSSLGAGKLDAWIDFDRSGSWENTEKIFDNVTLSPGPNMLNFTVPRTARLGPTYARFRLSTAGGLPPFGAAADGEVEDYRVYLTQFSHITNILITNITVIPRMNPTTQQVAIVEWIAETNVHYQLQGLSEFPPGMTNLLWFDIGPEVIGPTNFQTDTTSVIQSQRFYRVIAPWVVWPD